MQRTEIHPGAKNEKCSSGPYFGPEAFLFVFQFYEISSRVHAVIPSGAEEPAFSLGLLNLAHEGSSMAIYDKLKSLNITLPKLDPPVAAFAPFVRAGSLVFISGHIAKKGGQPWTGKLGADLTTAEGKQAAQAIAIDLLATLQAAVGDLNKIHRIVKLLVLVNSAPTFTEQHLVANGASELFVEVLGRERGAHARSAFGVAQIPFGACVEIELIAELL
jgi:enamine deaminase RidA (YjgF/YER057c/UK114 family)